MTQKKRIYKIGEIYLVSLLFFHGGNKK